MKTMRTVILALCCLAAGCNAADPFVFVAPEGPLTNKQIHAQYRQTILKQSTSAEVLSRFVTVTPKNALLSQNKSIAAIAGTTERGHKMWFNMVTFDESELIAKRKYYFISNDRPKHLFVEPWEGVDFGCKMVLSEKILGEPYADENTRRIAILKAVDADIRKDTSEIGGDNTILSVASKLLPLCSPLSYPPMHSG